jgi:quinol monooxygenase YgiN
MPEYFRFIRITFDPSKYDAMMAHADSQVERIKGVPGVRAVRTVRVAENQTITIGRYDSKEAWEASAEQITSIWSGFAEFMTEEPYTRDGDMVWSYDRESP